jgi:hypothetical protein
VDFKLENVLVSLHSLKTMGLRSIIFKEWRVTWTFSYTYITNFLYINIHIDWCLTPTLAIFQLYRVVYTVSVKIVRYSIIVKGQQCLFIAWITGIFLEGVKNKNLIKIFYDFPWSYIFLSMARRGRRGRDRMVIRFTSTIYNYLCNRCLEPLKLRVRSWRGVLDTTLCNKVYQWLATSRWFFPGKWQDEISKEKHYVTCYLLHSL